MTLEYTSDKAYITCEGNSLVSGSGSVGGATGGSFPVQLARLLPGSTVRNGGSAGQTTLRMTEYTGGLADIYASPSKAYVLIAWEGTNSIFQTGTTYAERTASQALEEMRQYCAARIAAKPYVKIVLLTTIPRMGGFWGTAVGNQHLLDYNAGLIANAASWGVAQVVDVRKPGSPFNFTGYSTADFDASSVSPYWMAGETGHIHLNDAGYGLIAQMVADGLAELAARENGVPPQAAGAQRMRMTRSGVVRLRNGRVAVARAPVINGGG